MLPSLVHWLLCLVGSAIAIRLMCEVLVLLDEESPDLIPKLPKSERPLRVYGCIACRGLMLLAPFVVLLYVVVWAFF